MSEPMIPGMPGENAVDQWRAESIQMVNWGGFEGLHRADLSAESTLLTGASGTGKSTLLDAYIALMMDSNIAFNGASNDNVSGRARSADQRNVLSYVRGKINTSRDPETGDTKDEVLRGDRGSAWSGVAMTWVNDDGTHLTALRLYYAPASARASRDVKAHMAIYPGQFTLTAVEPFARAEVPFHHSRMATRFKGMTFHDSYSKFAAALHKHLGIGKMGDGASAMRLLARIQGGRQVASVDGLYKDMVLDVPQTYAAADRAIEHFAALESAYETMRTAQQQVETLAPITAAHRDLRTAEAEVDMIDTFRVSEPADGATPLSLWAHRTESALLDEEIKENRAAERAAEEARRDAAGQTTDLEAAVEGNQRQQRENGGDALAEIEIDIQRLTEVAKDTEVAHGRFAQRTLALGAVPGTRQDFLAARTASTEFLAQHPALVADLDQRMEEHSTLLVPARAKVNELAAERSWLRARTDLIPQGLHEARVKIAATAGLDPADLPFIAELIDLAPDHEQWREAAELLLGGFARTMLVDRSASKGFRTKINALRLSTRIQFNVADIGAPTVRLDPATLPGRFTFREDSPFTGWLQTLLDRRFDYLCVPDPTGFADDGRKRITLAGQVQDGDRGAHGGHGARPILGFSNERRLTQVEADLTAAEADLSLLTEAGQALKDERDRLATARTAHEYRTDTSWESIDVGAADLAVSIRREEHERLLANSDVLAGLKEQETALRARLEETRRVLHRAEESIAALNNDWGVMCEREDAVNDRMYTLEDDPALSLSETQTARLDAEYAAATDSRSQRDFADAFGRVRKSLAEHVRRARKDVETQTAVLTGAFRQFQARWPRPNLATGVESFSGYQEILDDLVAEGLGERRDAFTQKVIEWSGEDLLGLHRSFTEAVEDIEYRLIPVNDILAGLPFGADADRLQITLRSIRGEDIKRFRHDLKVLASQTTALLHSDEVDARFQQLRTFIKRIRKAETGNERDYLLDVRRHVHIEAERIDAATGAQRGIYDSLGGKSGGETQELIAFIVGAALRYQLGDETQPRPVYAPVFLDEGFVKSDSEFAGRAVDAWRGLGFQLIIGAPLDKVTAIEPYMDRIIHVTKSSTGYSLLRHVTPVTPARQVERV